MPKIPHESMHSATSSGVVLAYHSHHVVGDDYARNDHVALALDLELITAAGFRIVSLSELVDSWERGTRRPDETAQASRLIALTCDDGPVYDVEDFLHPRFGYQRSFLNIMRDFLAKHPGKVQSNLHLTSFVIASPEARAVIEQTFDAEYTYLGARSLRDDWWMPAIATRMVGIANHSWDHLHPALSCVLTDFRQIATDEEADAEVAAASAFIAQRTGGKASPFFAYPFGHYSDFLVSSYFPRRRAPDIRAAFSVDPRPMATQDSIWCLPRYVCGDDWRSSEELLAILTRSGGQSAASP